MCKKLFCILLLALLLLPAFGASYSQEEKHDIAMIYKSYVQNYNQLNEKYKTLQESLKQLQTQSGNSEAILLKQIDDIEKQLTLLYWKAKALETALSSMDETITDLETSLKVQERWNKLLKYGLAGTLTVAIIEAIIIAVK